MDSTPAVPLTVEGSSVLHQMMRFRWDAWRRQPAAKREALAAELASLLSPHTALFSLLGHKGDLMLVHFRPSFAGLNDAQLALDRREISDYLEHTTSYLSMIELGLYESTGKTYADLTAKGITPHSEEWTQAIKEVLERQRAAMAPRLYPEIPAHPWVCFYPMDRRRGEHKNWYSVPMADRARMMHEHGMVGRRYAGAVRQIISGSIGFDDWEWGVDLFAEDPLIFKQLIYEMRFDEVSAVYALFGTFYVGQRVAPEGVAALLKVDE